jgi:hypothetical protein
VTRIRNSFHLVTLVSAKFYHKLPNIKLHFVLIKVEQDILILILNPCAWHKGCVPMLKWHLCKKIATIQIEMVFEEDDIIFYFTGLALFSKYNV